MESRRWMDDGGGGLLFQDLFWAGEMIKGVGREGK